MSLFSEGRLARATVLLATSAQAKQDAFKSDDNASAASQREKGAFAGIFVAFVVCLSHAASMAAGEAAPLARQPGAAELGCM